ncbi:MAG: hypothetical protein WB780_21180 [Candidatus Acidiferrales bacterium]
MLSSPEMRRSDRNTIQIVRAPTPKDFIALAQNGRRVAEELEQLSTSLHQANGPVMIMRYAAAHQMEIPRLDLAESVRALRSNAGMLFLIANSLQHRAALANGLASSDSDSAS